MFISKKSLGPVGRLARDERGNMTEYIILVGVIALVCLAAFRIFGTSVSDKIESQATTVDDVESGPE